MSIFIDKRFEQLDWISKAVEPVECSLNEILAYLPEEIEITPQQILFLLRNSRHELPISEVIEKHIRPEHINQVSRGYDKSIIAKSYKIQFKEKQEASIYEDLGDDEDRHDGPEKLLLKLDTESQIMSSRIFLKKISIGLSETEVKQIFGKKGYDSICRINYYRENLERIKEVIEMLGPVPGIEQEKTNSARKKFQHLRRLYNAIAAQNTFNIKSVDLMDKLGEWIYEYVNHRKEVAFANICKLKIMTTMGAPIYSMEIEAAKNDNR